MPTTKNEIKFEQPSDVLVLANRFILVIVAVVVLAVLAAGYFFILRPGISGLKDQATITKEAESLQSINQALLIRLKELRAQYEDIKKNRTDVLHKLQNIIPDNPQIAELFVMAEKLAKDRGLILKTIDIVDDQKNDAVANAPAPTESDANSKSNIPAGLLTEIGLTTASTTASAVTLKSLIIHLSLATPEPVTYKEDKKEGKELPPPSNLVPTESTYDIFKQYLNDLEQNLRLMDVQTVSFGELDSGLSGTTFDISLTAYYK